MRLFRYFKASRSTVFDSRGDAPRSASRHGHTRQRLGHVPHHSRHLVVLSWLNYSLSQCYSHCWRRKSRTCPTPSTHFLSRSGSRPLSSSPEPMLKDERHASSWPMEPEHGPWRLSFKSSKSI